MSHPGSQSGTIVAQLDQQIKKIDTAQVEAALAGDHIDLVSAASDPPSNLSAAGQEDIMVRVRKDSGEGDKGTRFWIWLAADNLNVMALNAIACATELGRLRPLGKVQ